MFPNVCSKNSVIKSNSLGEFDHVNAKKLYELNYLQSDRNCLFLTGAAKFHLNDI